MKEHNQQEPGQYDTSKAQLLTTVSPGYPFNTTETQDNYLKSNLTEMIEAFKEELNKSLKEIQENTIKQIEVFKEETCYGFSVLLCVMLTGFPNYTGI